jgi:hypothetical protein
MAERQFPLVIWQKTDEFKQEYEQASKRFKAISEKLYRSGFKATYLGDLQFNTDGNPIVWLNPCRRSATGYSSRNYLMPPTAEEAIRTAKITGDVGWWTLEDLEQLLEGRGPIFDMAMFDMGYRRNKTNATLWAKFGSTKEYEQAGKERTQAFVKAEESLWIPMQGADFERLNKLWLMPNKWNGLDRTYSLKVGKRGFIHIQLDYNPFAGSSAETLHVLGERHAQRGHIAKQQERFQIEAQNIKLGKEKGIHVKATKADQSCVEYVLPMHLPDEKLYDLVDELVSKTK